MSEAVEAHRGSVPDELVERAARAVEEFELAASDLPGQIWANTTWFGVHALKGPWDLWAAQEIIGETRPRLIVETGVAEGGSALFYASLFDLMGDGEVIGVDVDLGGVHEAVRAHPRITLKEGSSTDQSLVAEIRDVAHGRRTMVILDSDHSAAHVARELRLFAPLVTVGCYLIVEDTAIGRPLGKELLPGPAEALEEWLGEGQPFEVDRTREKFLLTGSPGGSLRRLGSAST
jgi:cephalosporin hydroxylase